MPARALTPTPKTYAQLRDAVIAVIVTGRIAIDRAWVDTCHETGRLINEHVLLFRERADYGAKVYEKLAEDTKVSARTLRECAQFQRFFPIRRNCAKLGWSQCRLLCQVADETERLKLLQQAVKNEWTVPELETRVRSFNAVALATSDEAPPKPVELLKPRCGVPGLRRVVERVDGLGIDLGFKCYADVPAAPQADSTRSINSGQASSRQARFKAGDIVRWDDSGLQKIADATPDQLFTYRATIRKIIDGDTLDIAVTLAPGFTRDLKLRLRGLDCPELATAAGRAAKAFVEKLLRPGDEVIICTTKPDKYERYLADVFIRQLRADGAQSAEMDSARLASSAGPEATRGDERGRSTGRRKEQSSELSDRATAPVSQPSSLNSQLGANGTVAFLNNALLEAGHALRYDGGAKEE